jgi:hypothetical protein
MNTDYLKAGSLFVLTALPLAALSIEPPHLDPWVMALPIVGLIGKGVLRGRTQPDGDGEPAGSD